MLHTEPSFCIYNSEDGVEGVKENQDLIRSVTIGDNISSSDFSFGKNEMGLIKEDEIEEKEEIFDEPASPMYLATGFGVEFVHSDFDENEGVEEYCKSVLKEDPSNPLYLKKYAQLLQSKGDLSGAEHYYFQATLADPKDGDTLSQYAKIAWELHRDKDKASDYFERATHAAPENSDVLAAYASFLWDVNDDESEDETNAQSDITKIDKTEEDNRPVSPPLHLAAGLGIGDNRVGGVAHFDYTAAVSDINENSEEYYTRMIKENPHNPLLLRNYAQFLSQSKGDLRGAEEYYSRAILADPTDGETILHYAILIWQLHRDKSKASSYFKRAVQASPENSDVLAAYARFLWETEEDEDEDNEDEDSGDHNGAQLQGVAVANA